MDQFLEEESDLNGSLENGDDEMLLTGSPEPPLVDTSETSGPNKTRLNPFSGVSAADLEPDLELPADPHQENVDERFENAELNGSLSDILEPGGVEISQQQSAPSDDLKLEYTQDNYNYYTATETGCWFAKDQFGYWYAQNSEGQFEPWKKTDGKPSSSSSSVSKDSENIGEPAPDELSPSNQIAINDGATSKMDLPTEQTNGDSISAPSTPAPPAKDDAESNDMLADVVTATETATGSLSANEPLVPMSAADIQQTAASVVAELTSAENASADGQQITVAGGGMEKKMAVESLIPFDDMNRPVYPKNADGKPVLPINKDGKSVFQLDSDGYPVFPVGTDGEPTFPVDESGQPVFALGPNEKPMVPADSKGRPVFPRARDNTPIFPSAMDGSPTFAYLLTTKRPVLPLDSSDRAIIPYAPDGRPLIKVGPDGKTPVENEGATPMPPSNLHPAPFGGVPVPPHHYPPPQQHADWNQYWAQYYYQQSCFYYGGAAAPPGPYPPPMFGLPPPHGAAAPPFGAMPPGGPFGPPPMFKKSKVRPEDIDLPSGPPPAPIRPQIVLPPKPVVVQPTGMQPTTTTSPSVATEAVVDEKVEEAKKEASKSMISKQIKAFVSMQKLKLEKEERTEKGEGDTMYGPKVPPNANKQDDLAPPGTKPVPMPPKYLLSKPLPLPDTGYNQNRQQHPEEEDANRGGGSPIRKIASPPANRRRYRRSRSSSRGAAGSSPGGSRSRSGSKTRSKSPPRRRNHDKDKGSSRSRSRSRSRNRSRSRSYSRSPRRNYPPPRFGWRGRGGFYPEDRWRGGGWRGRGGPRGFYGPPRGGGYYNGPPDHYNNRFGRRGGGGPPPYGGPPPHWSPRRRSPSFRRRRSSRSYSRSRSRSKSHASSKGSPDQRREKSPMQVDEELQDLQPAEPELQMVPQPVAEPAQRPSSKTPSRTARSSMAVSQRSSSRDMSISDEGALPPNDNKSRDLQRLTSATEFLPNFSSGAIETGSLDANGTYRKFSQHPIREEEREQRGSVDIFELTVKITDAHDQLIDWPARLLNDTRTVPILQYSCRPDSFASFKALRKESDERQSRKSATETTSSPVVFQNRPITFGLTSKFDQAAFLQKVSTSPADVTGAIKWKPFGAVNDEDEEEQAPQPVARPQQPKTPSPEPVLPPFQKQRGDAELSVLRNAALLSMEKAQRDLAYYDSLVKSGQQEPAVGPVPEDNEQQPEMVAAESGKKAALKHKHKTGKKLKPSTTTTKKRKEERRHRGKKKRRRRSDESETSDDQDKKHRRSKSSKKHRKKMEKKRKTAAKKVSKKHHRRDKKRVQKRESSHSEGEEEEEVGEEGEYEIEAHRRSRNESAEYVERPATLRDDSGHMDISDDEQEAPEGFDQISSAEESGFLRPESDDNQPEPPPRKMAKKTTKNRASDKKHHHSSSSKSHQRKLASGAKKSSRRNVTSSDEDDDEKSGADLSSSDN